MADTTTKIDVDTKSAQSNITTLNDSLNATNTLLLAIIQNMNALSQASALALGSVDPAGSLPAPQTTTPSPSNGDLQQAIQTTSSESSVAGVDALSAVVANLTATLTPLNSSLITLAANVNQTNAAFSKSKVASVSVDAKGETASTLRKAVDPKSDSKSDSTKTPKSTWDTVKDAGGEGAETFNKAVDTYKHIREVGTTVRNVVKGRKGAASGGSDSFEAEAEKTGEAVPEGVAKGIGAKSGDVIKAAKTMAAEAISAAKAELGIASPSTVFVGIGENIGDGLAKGILKSKPRVQSAMKSVTDSTVSDAKNQTSGAGAAGGSSSTSRGKKKNVAKTVESDVENAAKTEALKNVEQTAAKDAEQAAAKKGLGGALGKVGGPVGAIAGGLLGEQSPQDAAVNELTSRATDFALGSYLLAA